MTGWKKERYGLAFISIAVSNSINFAYKNMVANSDTILTSLKRFRSGIPGTYLIFELFYYL